MKPTLRAALLAATITLLSGGALEAQRSAALELSVPSPARARADVAEARSRLERAESLFRAGHTAAARREYAAAARLLEGARAVPARALLGLANTHHAEGRPLRAAAVLDSLAATADRHGDPVVQAEALLEAAVLYAHRGRAAEARARVERLLPLLASPYIPEATRARIRRRIVAR